MKMVVGVREDAKTGDNCSLVTGSGRPAALPWQLTRTV